MEHQVMGDYEIIREIGEGPLGKLFFAQHRYLKKPFALKLFSKEISQDSGFIHRFESEVALLSLLDHPHLVRLHNVSSFDSLYFLITDFISDKEGRVRTLLEFLKEQGEKLSEESIFQIAMQIASVLDYAHEKKEASFCHGSIHLNNLLIKESEKGLHVYLSDFGLLKIFGPKILLARAYSTFFQKSPFFQSESLCEEKNFSSLHSSFWQTLLFLAPEHKVSMQALEPSHKSDIFSFGVLLYYLLTNLFPDGYFEPPSVLVPTLKGRWDQPILRCLERDPTRRPDRLVPLLATVWASAKGDKEEKPTLHPLQPVLRPQELERPQYEQDPGAIFQVETSVGRYLPKEEEKREISPLLTEMVVIPGGAYLRGSNKGGRDEMPRHTVTLSPYAIDTHPVTNEQFVRFLEALGGEKDSNNNDIIRLRESRIKRSGGKLNIESGYAKHPVVGVTWYGAVAYAKWIGKRLPTEAEWEAAACSGLEEALYPTGSDIERSQANFFSSDTTAVMSYPPNSYGLYDMGGNVYEWCQDWYDYQYYNLSVQEPDNPTGPLQGVYRVLRGGCWKSLKEDLRCAHRHRNNPGTMNGTYGFRCAADVV